MSETPNPLDASVEPNAIDRLIQRAWDRFAALGNSDTLERDYPDDTQDVSSSDDDG
ncbi:MAG: hypothetical protein HIU84_04175 [Acidobacteria bacterium]|nr:hypothetical protein [Acidobacteriota bacterium]